MKAINELAEKIKDLAQKKGQELTDEEAVNSAHALTNLFEVLLDGARKDAQKKRRLKKEPGGFPLDGQYSCLVCGISINEVNGWYDWYGQTCLICRQAVLSGVIPTYIFKWRDSYYTVWGLEHHFDIKHQTARKYVREGKLIARIITYPDGKPYDYIFLKKENPELISRYSPERKSYDRHSEKRAHIKGREYKKEMRKKYNLGHK